MKRTAWFVRFGRISAGCLPVVLAVALSSCGGAGGGSAFFGEVSGVISDEDGGVVRGARVFNSSRETNSNSSGIYMLEGVSEGNVLIRAEVVRSGIRYSGQNVGIIFRNERTRNLNIALVRDSLQATIHGRVVDKFGQRVQGAKVFAFGNALTSSMDITDSSGNYEIRGLASGIVHSVTASARTFDSDTTTVTLAAGEDRRIDFALQAETNPSLPAPANLTAIAWTSPFEPTRSPQQRAGIEAVKRMIDPRRARAIQSSRLTAFGNHVEVDLYWDSLPPQYYLSLLGYGIYRALTVGGQSTAVDFLRDPNALFFADIDDVLREGTTYYYEITALNTSYPDFPNSESPMSNRFGVETLGDLFLDPVTQSPLTFHWQAALAATEYSVYLFAEYPSIGVNAIWDSSATPTGGTSQAYTGPALNSGQRYFFVVLGTANASDSRSLSEIGEFVAN